MYQRWYEFKSIHAVSPTHSSTDTGPRQVLEETNEEKGMGNGKAAMSGSGGGSRSGTSGGGGGVGSGVGSASGVASEDCGSESNCDTK